MQKKSYCVPQKILESSVLAWANWLLCMSVCVCVEKGVFQLIQQMQSNLSDDACEVTDIFSLPCQMHTNAVHPTGRTSAPCSLSRLFLFKFLLHLSSSLSLSLSPFLVIDVFSWHPLAVH